MKANTMTSVDIRPADKTKLTALLKYHVVPGRVTAAEALTNRTLENASGQKLPTADLGMIRADIRARNGILDVFVLLFLGMTLVGCSAGTTQNRSLDARHPSTSEQLRLSKDTKTAYRTSSGTFSPNAPARSSEPG